MRRLITAITALVLIATALPAVAHREPKLGEVRRATVEYRDVRRAEAAGYERFLDCFDSPQGGMGQHYVNLAALDGHVDAKRPEAMVYEVGPKGRLRLVAVEYIVPSAFVDPMHPPELFGRHFHLNAELDVWVLHAWVWKHNPSGTFADWNPRVRSCP